MPLQNKGGCSHDTLQGRNSLFHRKTNQQSTNIQPLQLTIQQRLLSGKQFLNKNLAIPRKIFGVSAETGKS